MLDLIRGLLNRTDDGEHPEPLTAEERRRLEHRERRLQRQVRRLQKQLDKVHCSSCMKEAPSQGAVALSKRTDALRSELQDVRERLNASEA